MVRETAAELRGREEREKGLSSLPSLLLVGFRLQLVHLLESIRNGEKVQSVYQHEGEREMIGDSDAEEEL